MNEARDYELSLLTPTSTDNGDRPPTVNDTQVNSQDADENRVLTLAELKELIESGNMDKIPNNKIIPETLNVRFPFENSARKKYFSNFYFILYIYTGCASKSIDGSYKKETLGN